VNRPELHPEEALISRHAGGNTRWPLADLQDYPAIGPVPRRAAGPIELNFEFEEDSDEHQAFKDWIKYGKPTEAPDLEALALPSEPHKSWRSVYRLLMLNRRPRAVLAGVLAGDGAPSGVRRVCVG
jgi:hypothetical protein